MRVLLVTSRAASKIVEEYAEKSGVDFEVYVMPFEVAALIPPIEIAKRLKAEGVKGFDAILTPGLVSGDVSVIEREVGIPTFKGPIHASDIPHVLKLMGEVQLSKVEAACRVLKLSREAEDQEELRRIEDELNSKALFVIGGVSVAPCSLRVVAEVSLAPVKGVSKTLEEALSYRRAGADIVDIGMVAGDENPQAAYKLVKEVKREVGGAVSVDSLKPSEIRAAVEAGADLVISVDRGNLRELEDLPRDVALVVLPTDVAKGYYPSTVEEKVKGLEEALSLARGMGFKKLIADPVLSPPLQPSLLESLAAYLEFSRRHPEVPLMMGVGNVTELVDADSLGVNALMTALAAELEVSLILTTEASTKTRGCVEELCKAVKMAKLAKRRGKPMKDFSLSLLKLKDKRDLTLPPEAIGVESPIKASKPTPRPMDPAGYVKVTVDRSRGVIVVSHFKGGKPTCSFEAQRAEDLYCELIRRGLVSTLDHAAYIGKELCKAELALKLGKSYVQDEELFN